MRAPRRHRGFTLIELLIAAALLAVLAVLSWRGLDAVLKSRDRIGAASSELRSLTIAFSQLDEDLRRSWPLVKLLESRAPSPIGFAATGEGMPPMLEVLRETSGTDEPWRLQRVAYRVNQGVLERGFGPWLPTAAQLSTTMRVGFVEGMIWQPILAGVAAVEWRGWRDRQGWLPATGLATERSQPDSAQQSRIPLTGIEVVVTRTNGERVLRIFAVVD